MAAFILVAVIAVALTSFLISRATPAEFSRYLEHIGRMEWMHRMMMGRSMGEMMGWGAAERDFLQAINRSLWIAGLTAAGSAAVLALILSYWLAEPLRRMTRVASRIARGDLSQRVEVSSEDEIGELARAMNAMAEALAHQESLRRQFIAEVVHELRTPLTVIQGNLEAMADGILPSSPEHLNSLHSQVRVLSRLVTDLRTLSLADAGKLEINPVPLEITELAAEVVDAEMPRAREKGVVLENRVPGGLPQVRADRERLLQVFYNLLDNALRHTPKGGSIAIEAGVSGRELVLSVSDTGQGIPPEDIPLLFQRFHSRTPGGSGIGLAVVKALVEAMGGRVWVESREGRGTAFYFTLPL